MAVSPSNNVNSGRGKYPRGTPTLQTPVNPSKVLKKTTGVRKDASKFLEGRNTSHNSQRQLNFNGSGGHTTHPTWSIEEFKALAKYCVTEGREDMWPMHHNKQTWDSVGIILMNQTKTRHLRSGKACRHKVVDFLAKKFPCPRDALQFYSPSDDLCGPSTHGVERQSAMPRPLIEANDTPQIPRTVSNSLCTSLDDVSRMYTRLCKESMGLDVPQDFLALSASAMSNLKENMRSNVLYNLAKGIGTARDNSNVSRFPINRMPMGLIEYAAGFFASDHMNQVPSCPADYRLWQQSMYCHFGQKWSKLHHGPMWSVSKSGSAQNSNEDGTSASHDRNIGRALVNIPALSERTLRRDIAASCITLNSQIQFSILDEAARVHPDSWWWIKADGCDIVSGLGESVRGEWSGDVDLNDSSLQKQYEAHQHQLAFVNNIGGPGRSDTARIQEDLQLLRSCLSEEMKFISEKLVTVNSEYSEKVDSGNCSDKLLMHLAWDVKELSDLSDTARQMIVNLNTTEVKLADPTYDAVVDNLPRQLTSLREAVCKFLKRVERIAATHVLVIMISPEEHSSKPYALPVQCIAYRSLKDADVRTIANRVIGAMTDRKMKVAGFTTNGEWNSLRSKGHTRPLSIFEVRAQARNVYSKLQKKKMISMLTPKCTDGIITAETPNPAVPVEILQSVHFWLQEGCSMESVIFRLRQRTGTVTPGAGPKYTWNPGKSEDIRDMLRSILAQLHFTHQIRHWDSLGVPFKSHMHVPEIHPVTGQLFCEREDEGHVLKRIASSLRRGCVSTIRLERFVEALKHPETELTYYALTGARQQSIDDVERLFSQKVIQFMQDNNYSDEAEYLRMIRNWRRAVDERGLSDKQRELFCRDLQEFIVMDLMTVCKDRPIDFSLMDINRPLNSVRGFTRETLIAMSANLETRQSRRTYLTSHGLPAEHPRSSTTDDVECFFSVLRDTVGKDFTLKQVYYGWRKVSEEFMKRMDPDLPFYYHTSSHNRFYEDKLPAFDEVPASGKRKEKRALRRELLGHLERRVSLPVRGSLSVRATFHNLPVELPPVPGDDITTLVAAEHSYS